MKSSITRLGLVAMAALACNSAFAQSSVSETRCSTAGGTSCSGPIPDAPQGTPLTSTFSVPARACDNGVRSFQVRLDITHEWVGDLRVQLQSPNGAQTLLLNGLAAPAGAPGSCQGDDVNALFGSAGNFPQCNTSLIPAVGGNVRSLQPLNALVTGTTGTWTLRVFDDANDNVGFLNDWSVQSVCTVNIALPGPRGWWLLGALLGIATLGCATALRRS